MNDIAMYMHEIAKRLPTHSKMGRPTIRSVSLELFEDGSWCALAGGHPYVPIGEYGGDYGGQGETATAALDDCARRIP